MKFIKLVVLLGALSLVACSSNTSSRGSFIENQATNYLMPKCPTSDIAADKSRNEKDFTYNFKNNTIKYHNGNISSNLNSILTNYDDFYNFLMKVSFYFHKERINNL